LIDLGSIVIKALLYQSNIAIGFGGDGSWKGCGRDKNTQNVVNNKMNMVERGVSKFDDSNFATPLSTMLLSLFTTFCLLYAEWSYR
jgi:hypothetical protein